MNQCQNIKTGIFSTINKRIQIINLQNYAQNNNQFQFFIKQTVKLNNNHRQHLNKNREEKLKQL